MSIDTLGLLSLTLQCITDMQQCYKSVYVSDGPTCSMAAWQFWSSQSSSWSRLTFDGRIYNRDQIIELSTHTTVADPTAVESTK